ncbi:MAG: aldehyde dehydrogenase family protein [Solirubrobacteraceae bacterium]
MSAARLEVPKTAKLLIDGAFVRSESGRYERVLDHADRHVANVPRGSRKDVRDAVSAARRAFGPWEARTAYNRGHIIYRIAETLERRSGELAARIAELHGLDGRAAQREVEAAVDVLVHYAGWTDKLHAVLGGVNPIAGPFLSFSVPEPSGVVAILPPPESDLLGLVSQLAPVLAAGNAAIAVLSERRPLLGLDLGEVLVASDVPPGVVNLLSGRTAELATVLAEHRGVDAISDALSDEALSETVARLAAQSVKRVRRCIPGSRAGLGAIEGFVEIKTAWHPVGA